MARTSLVHYIAPSAISITPNCNSSVSDLAVYVARGTKIKVNSKKAGIDTVGGSYQEWVLTGRNRRIADSTVPYTIYARLRKTDKTDGYLMFVPQQQVSGEWKDKYPYVTTDGLYRDVYGQESSNYYYVRLGDVTLPGADGREVILDTGILGTEQYNEEWNLNPDDLPLRVEIGCTIGGEDAGPTPYVYWGQDILLEASLVEGWESVENTRLVYWEIIRSADGQWPDQQRAAQFASTGIITLAHSRDDDDFLGQVATVFQVNAWGYDDGDSSGSQQLVILGTASITILSEVIESFDIVMSSEVMNYSPQTDAYDPADGIDVMLRATDQKGDIHDVTNAQFSSLALQLSYAAVGSDEWTPITVSGQSAAIATGNIPASAFSAGKSINIRLTIPDDGDSSGSTVEKELVRKTVAYVSDGEDSKDREWIYRLDVTTGYDSKTGTADGEPVSGKTGDDWNADLVDDFVPTDWSDNAVPISEQHPTAYTTWRDYDYDAGKWGDFHTPVIWSQWGAKGTDGDGVQYLYKLFDHELTDEERVSNIPENPTFNPDTKEWEAEGWYDDPQAPDIEMQFCYCSIIQRINGEWGSFQKLGMWSKWGMDGQDAANCFLDRMAVFIPTDSDGIVLEDYEAYVSLKLYAGDERLKVTDIVIDEGESTGYASLAGSALIDISGGSSVDEHKLSLVGASVTGTKVVLGTGWTVGLNSIKISVPGGQLLDEHVINLTISGTDHEGTVFTSFASVIVQKNVIGKDGERGVDGDSVEYVFIRTKTNTAPIIKDDENYTDTNGNTYLFDEHLPQVNGNTNIENNESRYQCTDDPKGTDATWKFEWVVKRIKILNADGKIRSWQYYSGDMSLWANWSKDGKDAPTLIVSPSNITYPANPNGTASAVYSVGLSVPKIMINGTLYDCTTFTVDTSTVSGVTYASSGHTITVSSGASPNGTLIAIGTYTSGDTTWKATLAITIGPERKRAIIRGPRVWQADNGSGSGVQYYSGQIGESYLDIVVFEGQYYQCIQTHTSSASLTPADTNYWTAATEFGFIASGLILAEQALIRNLVVEELKALKEEGVAAGDLAYGTYSAVNPGVFEIGTYEEVAVGAGKEVNYQPRYEVTFQIKYGKKYPVLTFYDESGNKVGDIDENIFANVETVQDSWNMMNLIFAGSTRPTHSDYNTYASAPGNTFYQFLEGYNKNSGTGVYTYTFGQRTGASTYDRTLHNGSNGRWQKSMDGDTFKQGDGSSSVGVTGNGMRTGYYVKAGPYKVQSPGLDGRIMERMQMDVYKCTTGEEPIGSYYYSGVLTKTGTIGTEWKDSGMEPFNPDI